MEEYRVDIKVRNNIILKKLEEAGYSSIGEFCRLNNMMNACSRLGEIINMKSSPLNSKGEFCTYIEKIADILGCAPIDFFTDIQMHTILKTNRRSIEVKEAEMKFMLEQQNDVKLIEDMVVNEQKENIIEKVLDTLTPREKTVIQMRMGLGEYTREYTLDECGEIFGVSGTRIRSIQNKALRKMRHPERANKLRDFLDE